MTVEEMKALFEKHDKEYIEFDRVKVKRSSRPDLHAFLLLDELIPDKGVDMVAGAEHDEVYLAPELEEVAGAITEEQVVELVRCGVRLGEYGFCMFV
jgi:hypothetical protein